jgi:hypothetical protein
VPIALRVDCVDCLKSAATVPRKEGDEESGRTRRESQHTDTMLCCFFSLAVQDLEEALLLDSSENNTICNPSLSVEFTPRLIPELIVSLLKGCDAVVQSWPNITTSNYQMFLRRVFRHKCEEYNIENPFNTDVDFNSLPLRTKVEILNYLCEFRESYIFHSARLAGLT